MKKILALLLAMVMVFALAACGGGSSSSGGASWADYQAYLIEKAGPNAPDLDEFKAQVNALTKWEDIDQSVSPWDQLFTTVGLSTWAEFQAGTVKEPAAGGGTAEGSGEPSGAPGDIPQSGTVANSAHGGTAGATSEADYQAYLKAWIDAEQSANSTMTDDMKAEFVARIDAMDLTTFPADMLFNGMLVTGAAMTYDEFVAENGVY